MGNAVDALVWHDSLSPRNVDTISFRVKADIPGCFMPKAGERMTVWQQGERFVAINGLLRQVTMIEVREWEQAGLIVRW